MKKVMKLVVMIVAIFSTVVNYASTTQKYVELENKPEEAHRTLKNPKVVIRNKKGHAVYQTANAISRSKTELVSDINLPKGKYTYEVIDATSVEIISFTVESNTVQFDASSAKTIFKPTLRVKDDMVLVSQLSLQKEPLRIKMYYDGAQDGSTGFDLIYTEKIGKEKVLQRAYDLDESQSGSYKIEFISNGKVFTETFTL